MSFAAPLWLAIGAIVVVAGALLARRADAARRRALERVASLRLLPALVASVSPSRRRWRRLLVAGAIGASFVALARPQFGVDWREARRRGIDVIVAIDVSRSMLARDVAPDRLRRAKLAVADLLERLGTDRVGLVAFAGSAFLEVPPTLDHAAFRQSLEALAPGVGGAPGTNVGAALQVAAEALATEKRSFKIVVLLSDGEDLDGDAVEAAKRLGAEGVKVYAIGVGTPAGELIPADAGAGRSSFVKDSKGNVVKSKLDEQTLRAIADATGGAYAPLGARNEGVEEIWRAGLAALPRDELASRMRQVPRDRFQWPLALAVLLLLVEPWIGERRRERTAATAERRVGTAHRVLGVALAGFAILRGGLEAPSALANTTDAEQHYREGRFEEALSAWRAAAEASPRDARIQFNLGTAAYRAGKLDEAATAFGQAIASEDPVLRQQSWYDLGNTQFRQAEAARAKQPDDARAAWNQAIASYDAALALDGKDADAQHNRQLAEQALARLEQEQKQKQEQEQKQEQQQKQEQGQQGDEQNQDEQKSTKDDQKSQGEQKPPQDEREPSEKEPNQAKGEDRADQQEKSSPDQPPPNDPQKSPGDSSDKEERGGERPQSARSPSPGSAMPTPGTATGADSAAGAPTPAPIGTGRIDRAATSPTPAGDVGSQGGSSTSGSPTPSDAASVESGAHPSPGRAGAPSPGRSPAAPVAAGSPGASAAPQRPGAAPDAPGDATDGSAADSSSETPPELPGQMAPAEARSLLESLRGDERHVPLIQRGGARGAGRDADGRDW